MQVKLIVKKYENEKLTNSEEFIYTDDKAYKYLVNALISHINNPRYTKIHSKYDINGKHVIVGEFTREINKTIKFNNTFEVTGEELGDFDLL